MNLTFTVRLKCSIQDLNSITDGKKDGESYFQEKRRYIKNFKKVILLCIHGATKRFEKSLINEQEVLNNIAEMMMETYVSESLALRVEKMGSLKGICLCTGICLM